MEIIDCLTVRDCHKDMAISFRRPGHKWPPGTPYLWNYYWSHKNGSPVLRTSSKKKLVISIPEYLMAPVSVNTLRVSLELLMSEKSTSLINKSVWFNLHLKLGELRVRLEHISPFSIYRLMLDHPPLNTIRKGQVMLAYWERTIEPGSTGLECYKD